MRLIKGIVGGLLGAILGTIIGMSIDIVIFLLSSSETQRDILYEGLWVCTIPIILGLIAGFVFGVTVVMLRTT